MEGRVRATDVRSARCLWLSVGAVALGAMLLSPLRARAVSSGDAIDSTIHQPFVSARALGMGGAFAAIADDYAAMFYNPAGLARLTESQTNLELRAMIDPGVLKFKSDIEKASSSSTSVTELAQILQQNYGKHYSSRVPTIGAYYVRPRWGFAFIPADLSLELGVNQLVGPAASIVATQDSTLALSYARDLKWVGRDRLSFGLTLKGIYRGYYNTSFTALDLATDSNLLRTEDAREGFTADADVGIMYSPDPSRSGFLRNTRPMFGAVVRNVVDYGFTSNFHLIDKRTSQFPRKLIRRYDVGFSFHLPDWWVWKSRLAFDLRDMAHPNWTFKKGSHIGIEFLWKIRSWFQGGWRAGLNQGYWTAGFTGKFAVFQLDLASYGEEVGSSEASLENRRYMAKCSLDW